MIISSLRELTIKTLQTSTIKQNSHPEVGTGVDQSSLSAQDDATMIGQHLDALEVIFIPQISGRL